MESVTAWSAEDVADVAALVRSLGHDAEPQAMGARLERLVPSAGHHTWVVRNRAGRIAAIAGAQMMWSYSTDEPGALLLLLVVDTASRREGTGSVLLTTFEEWARAHGARRLSAVSAAATDSAHRFYQKRGYHEAGMRYTRII